jgi:hypothetical protein
MHLFLSTSGNKKTCVCAHAKSDTTLSLSLSLSHTHTHTHTLSRHRPSHDIEEEGIHGLIHTLTYTHSKKKTQRHTHTHKIPLSWRRRGTDQRRSRGSCGLKTVLIAGTNSASIEKKEIIRRKTRQGTPEHIAHTHIQHTHTHTHAHTHAHTHTHTHTHTQQTHTHMHPHTQDHLAVNLSFFAIHLKHRDIVVPVHLVPRGMPVKRDLVSVKRDLDILYAYRENIETLSCRYTSSPGGCLLPKKKKEKEWAETHLLPQCVCVIVCDSILCVCIKKRKKSSAIQ